MRLSRRLARLLPSSPPAARSGAAGPRPPAALPPGGPADPAGAPPGGPALSPALPDAPPGAGGGAAPGPGAAAALGEDPCGPARAAVEDACSLAERMTALAAAAQERLRGARRDYDEHAGRRERAAAAADPRAVRAAKDEAQATFRRARLAAADRGTLEAAAREWLREIDRINARTREATRLVAREDSAEAGLLQALDRLGVEADGARIAAESAAEACRNARITLATCEERERLGATAAAVLAPASVVGRTALPRPTAGTSGPAPERGPATAAVAGVAAGAALAGDAGTLADDDELPADGEAAPEPAIVPLLAGDREVGMRLAAALAEGDRDAERAWQALLAAFVEAVQERAIDGAAFVFPEDHAFWGPYTQTQCREIAAALAALGYRFDGLGGFADGRIPGQRELSLAVGYAGLDPMRVRIWPSEAELPRLYADVHVDAARFLAEAAGDLTLGEMIDLLGRRAEELSDLWNTWGRVRPLLLGPA